ncbi:MAG: hypothetical protein ACRDWW_07925, partial [Acidimicrobiales bacterium]
GASIRRLGWGEIGEGQPLDVLTRRGHGRLLSRAVVLPGDNIGQAARTTEAEVAEAMGVAIMMNGGPGTVWGPRALTAFKEVAGPPE